MIHWRGGGWQFQRKREKAEGRLVLDAHVWYKNNEENGDGWCEDREGVKEESKEAKEFYTAINLLSTWPSWRWSTFFCLPSSAALLYDSTLDTFHIEFIKVLTLYIIYFMLLH